MSSNDTKERLCLQDLKVSVQENRGLDDFAEFFEETFLLHFVRGKKNDSKRAYDALQNYINVRKGKYLEMFKALRPSTNQAIGTKGLLILRHRDHLSRLVVIIRINCWNPREVPAHEFTNMAVLGVEEMWNCKEAEMNGIVLIFDMAGYNFHHAMAITVPEFLKHISLLWNNYPLRPRAVHIVNEMLLFTLFLNAVKPFLSKKIGERLNLHSSKLHSLHKHVDPSILPEFLGGQLAEEDAFDTGFEQRILDKEDYYQRFAGVLKNLAK